MKKIHATITKEERAVLLDIPSEDDIHEIMTGVLNAAAKARKNKRLWWESIIKKYKIDRKGDLVMNNVTMEITDKE